MAHAKPGQPVDGRDDQRLDVLSDDRPDGPFEVAPLDGLAGALAVIRELIPRLDLEPMQDCALTVEAFLVLGAVLVDVKPNLRHAAIGRRPSLVGVIPGR